MDREVSFANEKTKDRVNVGVDSVDINNNLIMWRGDGIFQQLRVGKSVIQFVIGKTFGGGTNFVEDNKPVGQG
jgi:hypothetical protein